MDKCKEILKLIIEYCSMHLGYKISDVQEEFVETKYSDLVALKLANANVVTQNKKDSSSHQSHIAITGEAIAFFYTSQKFAAISSDDPADEMDAQLLDRNIESLRTHVSFDRESKALTFTNGKVSVGKRTQNQVQLSKIINQNSDNFNELRNGLFENDLLIMLKRANSECRVFIGIPSSFYNTYIDEYDSKYNSSTYFNLVENNSDSAVDSNDSEPEEKSSTPEKVEFTLYAEKSADKERFCYFCGLTLEEYMKSIPEKYQENDIQRGIVKNVYLDKLVKTIVSKDNIPTITLVADKVTVIEDGKKITVENYRILDGLQRTYRIREIWKCMNFFENLPNKGQLTGLNKIKLSRLIGRQVQDNGCDLNVLSEIIKEYQVNGDIERFWKYYRENEQWFEIWENLSLEQETEKMLILNAGHRQMDIRHQLELLFLNDLPVLSELCSSYGGSKIIRNKEKSDMQYSKERQVGEFYFSHIISAIVSYSSKRPITTNTELVNKLQQDVDSPEGDISYDTLTKVMKFLINFDKILRQEYGNVGVNWLSKETVLVGVFAALAQIKESDGIDALAESYSWNVKGLSLLEYEEAKKKIDVSKVNVGNVTKSAVMHAILDLISNRTSQIDWDSYFGGNQNDED